MEQQNTREQLAELRAKSKISYKYLIYSVIGISVFAGYINWSIEDTKRTVRMLKSEKIGLQNSQDGECSALKTELENLVRKEVFQESYKNQQENIKEGIFMYSQNESNTKGRQQEIISSLDSVCTKNNEKIKEIDEKLKTISTAFAF